jgi:hypothetical protein
MRKSWLGLLLAGVLLAGIVSLAGAAERPGPAREPAGRVEFSRDIRPVISANCFACHGPDAAARQAGLRLDRREEAIRDRDGARAIETRIRSCADRGKLLT